MAPSRHKQRLLQPLLNMLSSGEVFRTQADPSNRKTINMHEAYDGLSFPSQARRQKLYGKIRKYWPGEDVNAWFPAKYRPEGFPDNPLDWSEPCLKHLKDLASATRGKMDCAHKHLQSVAEDYRGDVEGRLCSRDIKKAVRRRYKEIGNEAASNGQANASSTASNDQSNVSSTPAVHGRPIHPLPRRRQRGIPSEASESSDEDAEDDSLVQYEEPPDDEATTDEGSPPKKDAGCDQPDQKQDQKSDTDVRSDIVMEDLLLALKQRDGGVLRYFEELSRGKVVKRTLIWAT